MERQPSPNQTEEVRAVYRLFEYGIREKLEKAIRLWQAVIQPISGFFRMKGAVMTGKRDKKGRVLRQGERQREDGRYEYRYKDAHGETRSVYSWRLVESDSTP